MVVGVDPMRTYGNGVSDVCMCINSYLHVPVVPTNWQKISIEFGNSLSRHTLSSKQIDFIFA